MKTVDPSTNNLFRAGMKVEALDRQYPGLVWYVFVVDSYYCTRWKESHFCSVATIQEVKSDRVQVYFDGWNHNYDYWCCYDSPEIQPIGTWVQVGSTLQTPGMVHNCCPCNHTGNMYVICKLSKQLVSRLKASLQQSWPVFVSKQPTFT